jgi:hypothetical protein
MILTGNRIFYGYLYLICHTKHKYSSKQKLNYFNLKRINSTLNSKKITMEKYALLARLEAKPKEEEVAAF